VLRVERLRDDHAVRLLAFERANRAYFARIIPDRGDAYFEEFAARHAALLADQAAGLDHFHVVVEDGRIVARINLMEVTDGSAALGYRVAEDAGGRGVATFGVREVCALAKTQYGLKSIKAMTTANNLGSQAVLARAGFARTGNLTLNNKPAFSYLLELT
jgi:ribosomal-protein-alanine N-acetyltransferase